MGWELAQPRGKCVSSSESLKLCGGYEWMIGKWYNTKNLEINLDE